MTHERKRLRILVLAMGCAGALSCPARAQEKASISGLADVDFGLVAGTAETRISQSVCAFTSSRIDRYSVRAQGSGSAGEFLLTSGPYDLQYDVLWSDAPNAAGGTSLAANVVTGGFVSPAKQHRCQSGEPSTATLSIVLRSQVLQRASAGTYAGSLQITLVPE